VVVRIFELTVAGHGRRRIALAQGRPSFRTRVASSPEASQQGQQGIDYPVEERRLGHPDLRYV
jgi:hypothetical protein